MASADGQPIWLSVDGEVVTAESGVRQGKHERGLVHGLDVGRAISRGHARGYGRFTWVPGSRSRSGERIVTARRMCGGRASGQGLAGRPVPGAEDDGKPWRRPGGAGGGGGAALPIWLVESLRIYLEKQAAVGPLLVSLDDLHWADPVTLHALRTLSWQLASYPLAWILARQSSDRDNDADKLFDLLESEGAARISLQPLSDSAVAELVTDALGAVPDPGLLALAAGTAGNPLLLAQLVAGLLEEDAVVTTTGRASLRSAHAPRRVEAAVRDTLAGLGGATRQLLETAAVLGRSFRLEDAAAMLSTSPAALLPAVDDALAAGVLLSTQDALTFRHELVWQGGSESLPGPGRRGRHRHIRATLSPAGRVAGAARGRLHHKVRTWHRAGVVLR